ncbi:helix-turn-helix domain-containing protein [Carboxydochorda subterranea]|uniref:Helix-turn-helix domain-containing protein n=1 Tax=Carboxydichorda subterranea TaxID=3109565 RepID=A0ABZ1BW93_9FIRM|nr:helix-turn-helix domain-containing protein [Limnochorda sp. L945t]WRP16378.1 helix-turn-helix domain-containing protein [Limnochorda sp. L945t]
MPGVEPTVPVYPIGVVERLTGLSARQIRYYEKEGLLAPSRTRGNRRLFSPVDVERLRQVKSLMAQGLNVEGVRAYLASQGGAAAPAPAPGATPAAHEAGPAAPGPGGQELAGEAAVGGPAAGPGGDVTHPSIFRQARGRRLTSLFPVDHQDELVRWLEEQRQQ